MKTRIALVTGGTGGIGTEVCRELSDKGHTVIAGYLPSEAADAKAWCEQWKREGYDFEIAPVDVACYESSQAMMEDVRRRFGPVEILVNCAGITRDKTLKRLDPAQWKAVINTNLDSVYNVSKVVLEGMIESGFGRIVNISSVNGQKGQFGQTNYSAAKAGVHGFTKALAQEVATKNITVNSVSPGYVETQMTAAIPQDVQQQIMATIPMQRMAHPSEVAHVVGFLCEEKSAYVTGANIPVNGGMYMS